MITSKYYTGLVVIIFCFAFFIMVSGSAAATANVNTTHMVINQSSNHTTTELNTIKSNIKINNSKSLNLTHKTAINDPQIYKNGVAVARGGHPAGYIFPSIGSAVNAALSGDTIMLENGGVFNETNMTITKNLAFDVFKNGQATINAQSEGQVFFIVGGVSVQMKNLIIENGKASGGGAIGNVGALTLTNCIFKDNTATSNGGAISNDGTLTVNNCTFTNNTAANEGGAIYNLPMGFKLLDSTFTANKAINGGAVYNEGGAVNYPVAIIGSTFKNNTAINYGEGGAIYNTGNIKVTKTNFTGNNGTFSSGAIQNNHTGAIALTSCQFLANTAQFGGAIGNDGYLSLTGSSFIGNIATAGIDKGGAAIYNDGKTMVTASLFTSNKASNIGGAVDNEIAGIFDVSTSTFTYNTAINSGGAIENGNGCITNAHLNRIVYNTAKLGSAIDNDGIKVNAILNWWGCNTGANIAKQIKSEKGTVNYNPWIVLNITRSPAITYVGGYSNISVNLLYDSNGVYKNPAKGSVPYTSYANFKTNKGTIKNTKFIGGKAASLLTHLTTQGVATVSTTVDGKTLTTNILIRR
jgi:predicted outer membrane repeat protein